MQDTSPNINWSLREPIADISLFLLALLFSPRLFSILLSFSFYSHHPTSPIVSVV
jgi:hypothetical protein